VIPRRSLYFVFQGLLTAVLLLLFVFRAGGHIELNGFPILLLLLAAPLAFIQLVPPAMLTRWWFQSGFFIADAAAASWALRWNNPDEKAYLVYFLIILSTALMRSFRQSVVVGLVSCGLFLMSSWSPAHGLPGGSVFWLQLQLLIITTCLLTVLGLDAQKTQADSDRRYQLKLIQAERLATLGRIAGEVAHRIKAPLTTIRVNAEVLSHKFAKTPQAREQLAEIEHEVERCKEILKSLLDLGRIEEISFSPLDLRDPIREALGSLDTQIKTKGVRLTLSGLERPLRARGDHSLLQEAVTAVVQNAVEAVHRGGRIAVRVERPSGRGPLAIVVEDDGRGIPEADLDRIFQPFYTTKGSAGSGLGLSAVMRIAQKHGGLVEAHSDGKGKGARITLTLPAS
jgi:signal transduction histidine kinase